ncbi:MAG: rhombosortase [Chromatiales bacterium]|jgi:rhomboid family GlyGly-CTERM serine protease
MSRLTAIWQERHGGIALPWRTLLLLVLAVCANLLLGFAPGQWVFDADAVAQGELWRLFTAHWLHSDAEHALWDIAALAMLGWMFEQRLAGRLFGALLMGTVAVNGWLLLSANAPEFYCGLSGILNSLLVVGLVQTWRDWPHPVVWLTGVGALLKIVIELNSGQALITDTVWPSVPQAHAAGYLAGLLLSVLFAAADNKSVWLQSDD